jgi:hypothetical protein
MKKVRLAMGVAAAPVLGMMVAPAAHAAPPAPGTRAGASVLRTHFYGRTHVTPATDCGIGHGSSDISPHGNLLTGIVFSGNCVAYQFAALYKSQTGLTERIRFRNTAGKLLKQDFIGGTIANGITGFGSSPEYRAYEVCQALVANSNHSDVKYGPNCEYTS